MVKKSGGSAINNLLLGDIKRKTLPLPPFLEQHSIVTKVDELFALCDQLIARITHGQEIKKLLANAVVERAVG